MASLRRVRREFRKELLKALNAGEGRPPALAEIAGRLFGREVGYEVVLRTFLANEVSNGLAQLRLEGLVETTGRFWKPASQLDIADVEIISVRRLKRLRGELKAQIKLAGKFGRTDEAEAVESMLKIISSQLQEREVDVVV